VQSSLFFGSVRFSSVRFRWPPVLEVRFGIVPILGPPKWRTIHPSKRLSLAPLSPPRLSSRCSASSAPSSSRHRLFCLSSLGLSSPIPCPYTTPIRSYTIPIRIRFRSHSRPATDNHHRSRLFRRYIYIYQAVQLSWANQFWEKETS